MSGASTNQLVTGANLSRGSACLPLFQVCVVIDLPNQRLIYYDSLMVGASGVQA